MFVRPILLASISFLMPIVATAEAPNVVIVMTDDQGYGDLACHGNPVLKTPNLDQLHSESLRLTDYHVSPTCSPTRAALLTGHWSNRTGVWHTIMGRSMLRAGEVTFAQLFRDAGYETGMFGKWHLGDNYPFRPEDRGFTEVMRHGGGGIGQTPDYWNNAYFDGSYWHNGKPTPVQGFCTDVFFDYAKRFIRKQRANGKPFLAYIATNAPHGPMHAPKAFTNAYKQIENKGLRHFYGMIANIDDNVGALRDFLADEGLAANTIFIFTTDNGTSAGAKIHNSGMRGNKGSPYDGGHRVPFFMHWPEGGYATGRDVNGLSAHVDVTPTLLSLCGIESPKHLTFDGVDLTKALRGHSANWPDRLLITDSQRVKDPIKWRQSSVMSHRWRLVKGKELYDIQRDPGQRLDVAASHAEVVARLQKFYDKWWDELLPTFQEPAIIVLGHQADNPARLTSHDWITTKRSPWNQKLVREAMNGDANTGHWNVEFSRTGDYEVRLRRWPEETNAALGAALPVGEMVPGVRPFRANPGIAIHPVVAQLRVGTVIYKTTVLPGTREAVFHLPAKAGVTEIEAGFVSEDGTKHGAYYAYVSGPVASAGPP
jgi:arylsulfatase B